jgi:nucleotide-binding universal stress UspA family protein
MDRVAESISAHSGEFAPDLIVMCTHGGGWLRERIFGSIAQKVVAAGTIPVLLVRPGEGSGTSSFSCRTVLLPLDADVAHERGFEAAAETARAADAVLRLLMVVPTLGTLDSERAETGRLLPVTTRHLLAIAEDLARAHLRERMEALKSRGVPIHASVRRGDPAEIIATTARETGADLVVLGTHGRSGFDAFWSESVAPRIVASLDIPLLLVPVGEE